MKHVVQRTLLVHTLSTYMWIKQNHKRQKPKNSRRN